MTPDGKEIPTSQSIITVRGITSGIRGLKVNTLRPDCVLIDDVQDSESASSAEQVQKIHGIIQKDIMNLSSKGKMVVISTATPLNMDDLTSIIEKDVNWKTTKYKAIIQYPKDIEQHGEEGLWGKYFKMYDDESMIDAPHTESLKFY